MKKGVCRGRLTGAGFTIVETMIVLAITGGLFVAVAATFVGRQNQAEFNHAIQSVQSEIQQTIDQVSRGFYPNANNFTCDGTGGVVSFSAVSTSQGSNQGCVFLGKVMQFQVQNIVPEQTRIYTVAGLQCDIQSLSTCLGTAGSAFVNVKPTVVGVAANYTDYSSFVDLQYGLTTLWVRTGATNIGAVGFLMEPGSLSSSTGGYNSGSQPVDLIPLPGTALNQPVNSAVTGIENLLRSPTLTASAPVNPANGVQICFVSNGTNQSGLITIGGSGRQLLVKLDIKSSRDCT